MNTKSRIESILKAHSLDFSSDGPQTFRLADLELAPDLEFALPNNLRLGHLAERVVSEAIKTSRNYQVLYENTQIVAEGNTLGEIDFMLEEVDTEQLIHLELAYKFYLFDPTLSDDPILNWIGPNRKDSLHEKLEKLRGKQFPLLNHSSTKAALKDIDVSQASSALCLLASLFIPFDYEGSFSPPFEQAIKGRYLSFEAFLNGDHAGRSYYLPAKSEWGIEPSENENWMDFNELEPSLRKHISEKQAPLCWQKHGDTYTMLFITWW